MIDYGWLSATEWRRFSPQLSISKTTKRMNLFRIHNRRNRILMVFMTIMALLFIQTLPLHAHNPHGHHTQLDQMGMLDNHEHHSEIHVGSSDVNDEVHGPATEIKLSADVVVKNLKFGDAPAIAVLTFFIILFVPLLTGGYRWPINLEVLFITRGIAFRPPLRAPPL
jgi:hypothetical protein